MEASADPPLPVDNKCIVHAVKKTTTPAEESPQPPLQVPVLRGRRNQDKGLRGGSPHHRPEGQQHTCRRLVWLPPLGLRQGRRAPRRSSVSACPAIL